MKRTKLFLPIILGLFFVQSCDDGKSEVQDPDKEDVETTAVDVSILSGNMPSEVVFPASGPSDDPTTNRPAFDEFSWQTFIALSWPVSDERGVPLDPNDPNTFLQMTNQTSNVWTSYKNQWDLFNQKENVPSAWDKKTDPIEICPGIPSTHGFMTSLAAEVNESFSVPLVDQQRNYVYFEISYNKVQYNFIRDKELYDNSKLMAYQKDHDDQVQMPISTATQEGSIMVKSAWKKLSEGDDESRYYVIDEYVFDPVAGNCVKMKLGLIGFHIAQKVDQFSQWVWSSFEQIDNVPGENNGDAKSSLNNGTDDPSTEGHGYANKPDDTPIEDRNKRIPVQVTRLNPIPTTPTGNSTVDINKKYQAIVAGTWMQYYQLVITQWPTDDTDFLLPEQNRSNYPETCGQAFPVANCINTTMETYFQSQGDAAPAAPDAGIGGNSCMGCHYTAASTDFSFSLRFRTHSMLYLNLD